jgi:hypothetical protein
LGGTVRPILTLYKDLYKNGVFRQIESVQITPYHAKCCKIGF